MGKWRRIVTTAVSITTVVTIVSKPTFNNVAISPPNNDGLFACRGLDIVFINQAPTSPIFENLSDDFSSEMFSATFLY